MINKRKKQNSETLEAVHTHTHTCILLKKVRTIYSTRESRIFVNKSNALFNNYISEDRNIILKLDTG